MTPPRLTQWHQRAATWPEFAFIKTILTSHPGAEVYLVGGAVRDILLERDTKDFDFVVRHVPATDLEKTLRRLGHVDFVGKHFGVFRFVPRGSTLPEAIDIALPRTEQAYGTGGYHDVEIQSDPALPISTDVQRRDFTINAMAWRWDTQTLEDSTNGVADLEHKIIRAVGDPGLRFQEDASRLLRAIRFAMQLDFTIESATQQAMVVAAPLITKIAAERIQTELTKIMLTPRAATAIRLMDELGLLPHVIPELTAAKGVDQNKNHIYDVYEHLVRSLDVAAQRHMPLTTRWAALLHDIGKPRTKAGTGRSATFYDHDRVGATMTKKILQRFNYDNDLITDVTHLVRSHMFYYSMGEITDAGVRRFIRRVGQDYIQDLIDLRICDRLGMGRPKAKPYKLIELERRVKEVQLDPITTSMLAIDGHRVMELTKITPGRRIGLLMNALLNEVLEDPGKNTVEHLESQLLRYNEKTDDELKSLSPDIEHYEEQRRHQLHQS